MNRDQAMVDLAQECDFYEKLLNELTDIFDKPFLEDVLAVQDILDKFRESK